MIKKRVLPRILTVFAVVTIGIGSLLYFRPTWVFSEIQELRLRIAGVESYQVMVDGYHIHYYVRGPVNGSPVVLIHGLGGRAEDWTNLAPYLEEAGYRVYTPDLLGFGQSEEPKDAKYSIADESTIMVDLIDQLQLGKVDLGGWSMGGWVAQKVAADHPDHVRRLVLMDSAGLRVPPSWDLRLFTPSTPAELDQLDALLTPRPPAMPRFVAADILRLSASYAWVTKRALASMMTAEDVMDAELPSLRMPVLILWGDQDRITPLSEGQLIHKLIPHSSLVVASGCGHLAPSDCAGRFGTAMVQFLEGTSSIPRDEAL